jgi:hypothetical protein
MIGVDWTNQKRYASGAVAIGDQIIVRENTGREAERNITNLDRLG